MGDCMSRAVIPDFSFDKNKFSELLIKAQGRLSLKDFAIECEVSVSYMCKYINCKFEKAPTPNTIKKIATYTEKHDVSLEDLLNAAGYSVDKYSSPESARNQIVKYVKLGWATITAALSNKTFKWSCIPFKDNISFFDYTIEINDPNINKWSFEFLYKHSDRQPHSNLFFYYGALATQKSASNDKVSFVTCTEQQYSEITAIMPHNLLLYVSVILIDIDTMTIVKEEYLDSRIPVPEILKKEYVLT